MKYEYVSKKMKLTADGKRYTEDGKSEWALLNEMGRKGFRYVGYHPGDVIGFGRVNTIILIFEREKGEE